MHNSASIPAPSAPSRPGRPPLSQRRKDALRLEIAREAVRLFTDQGVAATTGEEIARAVGVSSRTLWRHFPTKESCARPLLAAGLDVVTAQLDRWPPGTPLLDFLQRSYEEGGFPAVDVGAVLHLIRMTDTEPGLRAVWLQTHDDALPVFAAHLARRADADPDELRVKVHAAMINGALRAAVEDYARASAGSEPSDDELAACLYSALRTASLGLPY